MKLKFGVILVGLSILGCATIFEPTNPVAFGMRWDLLWVDSNEIQVFYLPESLTISGVICKYKARSVNNRGDEMIGWVEVDCEKKLARSFDHVMYDKHYNKLGTWPDIPWRDIPKNINNDHRKLICKCK